MQTSGAQTRYVVGAVWMLALRWFMRVIGLISTIILARLLTPQDFGLVAMAMVVFALIDSMATTGVDLALIRDRSEDNSLHDAAWTIQILQGVFISLLLIALAPLAVDYFGEPRLVNILLLLALGAFLQGFKNVGTVAFRKELDFAREFRFIAIQRVIVFLVTVGLAFWLRDYRAMVIGMVTQSLTELILSYRMHSYRPRISTQGMAEIWGFSQWLLLSRIGLVLNEKAPQLIAGRTMGAALVGVYHVGVELGTIFVYEIVMPVRRALFPNLSVVQDAPDFPDQALSTVGMLALLCLPVGAGLYVVAEPLVAVLFGEKWEAAAPVLRWMGLFGAVMGVNLSLDLILLVKNRANLAAQKAWAEVLVLLPILVWVSQSGDIVELAEARFFVAAGFLPLMIFFVSRVIRRPQSRLYRELWRPFLAAAGMLVLTGHLIPMPSMEIFLLLPLQVFLGGFLYLTILILLWLLAGKPEGAEHMVVSYLRDHFENR